MLTIADAFTGSAALLTPGRKSLGQVLGCPGQAIEEVAIGDLHDRAWRARLQESLLPGLANDETLKLLQDELIGDLFPAAALLPDRDLPAHELEPKLFQLLARNQAGRWSTVLTLRVGETRDWISAGNRMVSALLALAFGRSLLGLASVQPDTSAAAPGIDLAILLDHGQATSDGTLLEAVTSLANGDRPAHVRAAASRLLRTTGTLAGHHEALAGILAGAGNPRSVEIFAERELLLGPSRPFGEMARDLGISATRVAMLRNDAERGVRAVAAQALGETRALINGVRSWLGEIVPLEATDDLLGRLGLGSSRTRPGALLLWLAGPYRIVGTTKGWLAADPDAAATGTRAAIAQDGGVRPARDCLDELALAGVRSEHRHAWLAACGALFVEDMVVDRSGSLAVVAERILFATGRAMAVADLAGLAGQADQAARLRLALSRDRRFVRVASDVYELAEWGSTPWWPRREPGEVPTLATLSDDRWWLPVPVDAGVLSGDTIPFPADLAEAIGLAPLQRRTLTSRYGPVAVVDESGVPTLGPLRHVALAGGARIGDDLWLGFDPAGEVTVLVLTPDQEPPAADRSLATTAQGAR